MEKDKFKKCLICGSMVAVVAAINNPYCDKCKIMHQQPDLPAEDMFAHEQLYRAVNIDAVSPSASPINTLDEEVEL